MKQGIVAGMLIGAAIFVAPLTGCGGGGSGAVSRAPTATTRARVRQLFSASTVGITQSGYQSPRLAQSVNGAALTASAPTPSGASSSNSASAGLPMVGAFLRNIEASNAASPTKATHVGRQIAVDPGPLPPVPTTGYYFDYYLGLWVQINDGPGQSTYLLFVDQAQTQPAGSIVTVWPTDYTVFPQTYQSTYSFTAGYLVGSHGSSLNVTNADGSSTANYNDTYADGSKDSGSSTQTAFGDYTWSGRTDAADGTWTTDRGTFRSDGSGGTHVEMSDGYIADYVYNADGSGHGRITGPDPGLPVTITFDPYGYTTITYADGTTEVIPGYGYLIGGGVPVPVSTGTATGSPGSGTTMPATAPPPVATNG